MTIPEWMPVIPWARENFYLPAATTWIGTSATFAAGDMLAIKITAATAGSAAQDLVVGVALAQA